MVWNSYSVSPLDENTYVCRSAVHECKCKGVFVRPHGSLADFSFGEYVRWLCWNSYGTPLLNEPSCVQSPTREGTLCKRTNSKRCLPWTLHRCHHPVPRRIPQRTRLVAAAMPQWRCCSQHCTPRGLWLVNLELQQNSKSQVTRSHSIWPTGLFSALYYSGKYVYH